MMMDQAENLRNIIRQQNQNSITNARVIAVTSGKGGVGKSNLSVNLALEFTRMGKKVIILDADFGLANVEVMFGVIPEYNLSDLMFKQIFCCLLHPYVPSGHALLPLYPVPGSGRLQYWNNGRIHAHSW